MTAIARRIAAGITLAAVSIVVLVGAGSAEAQTTPVHNGPSAGHSALAHDNTPKPGSTEHHHHQHKRRR